MLYKGFLAALTEVITIIMKYLYSAQSTLCLWRFTLKKMFKKLKVLQNYKKKASRKLHQ